MSDAFTKRCLEDFCRIFEKIFNKMSINGKYGYYISSLYFSNKLMIRPIHKVYY